MKPSKQISLFIIDFIAFNIAWYIYYLIRVQSGVFVLQQFPEYWLPALAIYIYWLFVFLFFGLYRSWYAKSRFDEFIVVFKAITFGCIILFFFIFLDDEKYSHINATREIIVIYWCIVLTCVSGGRILLHTFQRKLLEKGVGLENAIIIGINPKAQELFNTIQQSPAIGYKVIGFVEETEKNTKQTNGITIVGTLNQLSEIIKQHSVHHVLVALDSNKHQELLHIVFLCTGIDISIKILPDMYDIISGQARTNQIYGFPLIEIMPEMMQPWEQSLKRLIDVIVSIIILLLSLPLWIIIGIAIKLDSKGPIIFSQERVGKDGKIFKMYKFRSMRADAEQKTGPVWASTNDPRITKIGNFLRKTRLDEIPQFINVLDGDMSLVGPRPERPFFVEKLSQQIPLYKRRLKIRPGITGWAQIKQGYDQSIEDVKSKIRYDLFYIENMSIRMDIKILLRTLYTMLAGKGN